MIKLLHSADWHLDAPLLGHTEEQARLLRRALLDIPERIAELCHREQCDLMLLSGDLFDGPYTKESYLAMYNGLAAAAVPVFIAPGNHDHISPSCPWLRELWPENVHIFTRPVMESISLPALDCRIYGAGFDSVNCPGLLQDFCAEQSERWAIGVLHGDPTQVNSPYCPITNRDIHQSNLNYLALGHIHKGGALQEGNTLCAWPGCPMGRGYDETGEKGVMIVTVDRQTDARFVSLGLPRFYDLSVSVDTAAEASLETHLPPVGNPDFYRITLTGTSEPIDLPALKQRFSRFPNLILRDRTQPPVDVWCRAGEDSLEGLYFKLLQDSLDGLGEDEQKIVLLAAKISRRILDGQEVALP